MELSIGKVCLVGAGPGDPELITVRGMNRLVAADVVVYDELAGKALLEFCRPGTEFIYVGKRCGNHAVVQEGIIDLLRSHALLGRNVVRLKGGDPFIFGRGGEELTALLAAGISVEVVPGVTAAAAAGAAAGVPLTQRGLSSAVVFITGHENPDKSESAINWRAYAKLQATLCVYMGVRRLPEIADELLAGELSPQTPVAVVSRAALRDQSVKFLTLAELAAGLAQTIPSPAIAIIGEVARVPEDVRALAATTGEI